MIILADNYVSIDNTEKPKNIEYIKYNLKTNLSKVSKKAALKIDFKNDIKYSIKILKKLSKVQIKDFYTLFNNKKIAFIISNYNSEIVQALKALFIFDTKNRINYLYNTIWNNLNKIWSEQNPCKFCNNQCISARNHMAKHKEDGCCYSFEYTKNPFSLSFVKFLYHLLKM